MNIETKWLQDFLILSETKNFSLAAQLRFVTQPAFSRRIQALEKSLGCKLIDRRTNPLSLTKEGIAFQPTAQSVLHLLNNSAEKLQGNKLCPRAKNRRNSYIGVRGVSKNIKNSKATVT